MSKVLLIFAHPALESSRINKVLIEGIDQISGLHFHDLYQHYPDFYINVQREQELLLQHDIVVWQHPLYWYSTPPLLKQWIDLTLEHGWAYGSRGIFLRGKKLLSVITAGGSRKAYESDGSNQYSINEFLRPLEQTANLCGMTYLPPYVIHNTHSIDEQGGRKIREAYHRFLKGLIAGDILPEELSRFSYANDLIAAQTHNNQ